MHVDAVRAEVRTFVGARAGAGALGVEEDDRVVCTPAATRLLARATTLAGRAERIRPVHVLLAALDGIDDPFMGSAPDALARLGVDVRRLRRDLRRAARRA